MFQQPHRLTFDQLIHHVAQHRPHRVEPLVRLTYVGQSEVVEEDLLNDEDGYCFGEFGSCFHDSKAERDDFGGEEEVDDVGVVVLLWLGWAGGKERGRRE